MMMETPTMPQSIRELTRRAVRAEISSRALALFVERGFDETTIDQIAHAAGVSPRSIFRYFPTKEDLVVGEQSHLSLVLVDALSARPTDEDVWVSLEFALLALLDTMHDDPLAGLRGSKIVMSTPSLRARHLEKRRSWEESLVPLVVARLDPDEPDIRLRANALVSSALSCLDAAVDAWAHRDGQVPWSGLLRVAMRSVHPGSTPLPQPRPM